MLAVNNYAIFCYVFHILYVSIYIFKFLTTYYQKCIIICPCNIHNSLVLLELYLNLILLFFYH